MAKTGQKTNEIELEKDAWERFERAVKVVAKSPPQPKKKKTKRKSKKTASAREG